jgi:hypothetical protein
MKPPSAIFWLHLVVVVALLACAPDTVAGLTAKNKAGRGPQKTLWLFTPPGQLPDESGQPVLTVSPLLGPAGELMPGGKLWIWVGRSDGIPLSNVAVALRVPDREDGNALVASGGRTSQLTLHTDTNGLCLVSFAAPNKPKEKDGGNGGGETPE